MSSTRFEAKLNDLSESGWNEVLNELLPSIHEVDRDAVKIWFAFNPLSLHRHLNAAEDIDKEVHAFVIKGTYGLADGIDTSHRFLYGHRYWADVKCAVWARADAFDETGIDLRAEAEKLAKSVAAGTKTEESLVLGITLVALMTLNQTGLDEFRAMSGEVAKPAGLLRKSPDKIIAERRKDKNQGILGFLRTIDKEFSVRWDETDSNAKFDVIYDEEIASAAARDQSRDWGNRDERCIEGVIPVECRSAACGTCWVGVVGGADKLSDVERLERKQMKVFGYRQDDTAKPNIRLACQARAEGSVSIVLPPWNGVFGKKIYGVEEVRLEPATTAAAKLRETIADAMSSDN